MTLVREQKRLAQKGQASVASIDQFSNEHHKDLLRSNKPRPSKVHIRPPQALLLIFPAPDVAQYTQKDMNHLFQTFVQVSKGGSRDKVKAKTPDIYCNKSHIECYNFY